MKAHASILTATIAGAWLCLAFACGSTEGGTRGDSGPPPPPSWQVAMKVIDEATGFIDVQFRGPTGSADLPKVADAARSAAKVMALGYGPMDDSSVPGFAAYARKAEAWFLKLAEEAKVGNALLARDLFDQAATTHCVDCHQAAGI